MANRREASIKGGYETITLVSLLTWTYQRQRADAMSGRGLWGQEKQGSAETRQRWSGCGCAQLAAVAALGTRIEPTGSQRPALHPDAELVHDRVIELSRTDWSGATLLRRHGYDGDAPDWCGAEQRLEPVYDAQDRIVQDRYDETVEVFEPNGRRKRMPVRYCPLVRYPSDEWIAVSRAEYEVWHKALGKLAALLAGRALLRWQIAGLGASAEPWLERKRNKT